MEVTGSSAGPGFCCISSTCFDLLASSKNFLQESFNFSITGDESGETRSDDDERCVIVNSKLQSLSAIGVGCNVTVIDNNVDDNEDEKRIVCELELDHAIEAMAWDTTSSCIVIGDVNGTVHLMTKEGKLVFSKSLISGK